MAAGSGRCVALAALALCLFLRREAFADSRVFPDSSLSKDIVRDWAEQVGLSLDRLMNTITGHLIMTTAYAEVNDTHFKTVNESTLVQNMADKLSKMLAKKMDALWTLVQAAEETAKNYTYNDKIKKGDVYYINAKNLNESELLYDVHFDKNVDLNHSSVHIPVEIYDGDKAILNGLKWTEALDSQFQKNYLKDNQILWQFFGSQTGFMRTYPASKWEIKTNEVDLFDVRRQSWYTQGSSSPKDMMILIDTSGSTHGQALQLMKNAVKSILDTLGENDFVNIVEFSADAKFVSSCFNHTTFVQANYRNKKQLAKDVDLLKALGQADYKEGLRFVFHEFKKFNLSDDEHIGARCNKVIMLLTDGGTDNAEEIFKQYNWPTKPIRVFTYAVGPVATPVAAIKWMACANRGYFSQIPAMGAIRARVQEYIPVLSRPQVLKNAKAFEWSNMYRDRLGSGMMTTVTLPVYNRTLGSSNQTILGVMGIDVPTTELGKETPYEIGPIGYSFAINPNGYAVFHPNLRRSARLMRDPPNIDLMELEIGQDVGQEALQKLRNEMIEGNTATATIVNALFLSPDQKYVSQQTARYAFTNITNTTFRLGLYVPEDRQKFLAFDISRKPVIETTIKGPDLPAFLIAPWEYMGSLLIETGNSLSQELNYLIGTLASMTKLQYDQLSDSQKQLLHHLALDRKKGEDFTNFIKVRQHLGNDTDTSSNSSIIFDGFNMSGVLVHFMAANSGLTIIYPPSEVDKFDKERDIKMATYYTRSMYSTDLIFAADSSSYSLTYPYPAITVSRSVEVQKHRIAVAGVKLDSVITRDYILTLLRDKSRDSSSKGFLTCDDRDEIACYIIDDGGFLIASNQNDNDSYAEPGMFLGEVDPQVWNLLYNKSNFGTEYIFGRSVQYDFQAMCPVDDRTISAGHPSFFVPSLNAVFEVLTTGWWTSKITWAYTSFNVYNWIFGDSASGVYADDSSQSEKEECVLASQQFYLRNATDSKFTGTTPCIEGTDRKVEGRRISKTNLMLIVATDKTQCTHPNPELNVKFLQKPFKVDEKDEKELICSLSQQPHKRVRSYGCYDRHSKEDDSKCGAAYLPRSRLVTLVATLVTIFAVWLLGDGYHR